MNTCHWIIAGSRFCSLAAVLALALLWQSELWAAMYVCPRADGGKQFTNAPISSKCVVFKTQRPSPFTGGSSSGWSGERRRSGYWSAASYESKIEHFGRRYQIDPHLIKAVIKTESDFDRYAVSRRGARGLMQLMPETARELQVADPFNPSQNIEGGTRYLRYLLDTFEGDLTLALAAYNAGPTLVKRVQRVPRIPETISYVKRVLGFYQSYRKNGKVAEVFRGARIRVSDIVTVQ